MKIIEYNNDVSYGFNFVDASNNIIPVTDSPYYGIHVYTNDSRAYVDVTSFIDSSNNINFDSSVMGPLSEGQINFKVMTSEVNPIYQDGHYNTIKLIHTDMYFDPNSEITDLNTVSWGNINGTITRQNDLITYIDSSLSDYVKTENLDSSLSDFLVSNNYRKVVKLTDSEYQEMKEAGTLDEETLYITE